jgi:hypothetical protein
MTSVILEVMEILKEVTKWDVEYRQPNHTYLVNNKNQIVAYAKWHSKEIMVFKSRTRLDTRYRKFEKTNHKELSKLINQFKSEDIQKEEKQTFVRPNYVRIFKVKSKGKDYIVEYNTKIKQVTCPCIGFGYRRKCKHSDAVAKLVSTH